MGGKIYRYSPVSRKTHNLHDLKKMLYLCGDIKQIALFHVPRQIHIKGRMGILDFPFGMQDLEFY